VLQHRRLDPRVRSGQRKVSALHASPLIARCCAFADLLAVRGVNCRLVQLVFSKRYGVDQPKFTHRTNNIVYLSSKGEGILTLTSIARSFGYLWPF
jgi:hypothetical protein